MPIGIAGRRSRHARAHVFLLCILPSHGWFRWFWWWFLGVCDTPVDGCVSGVFGVFGLVGFALVAGLV